MNIEVIRDLRIDATTLSVCNRLRSNRSDLQDLLMSDVPFTNHRKQLISKAIKQIKHAIDNLSR